MTLYNNVSILTQQSFKANTTELSKQIFCLLLLKKLQLFHELLSLPTNHHSRLTASEAFLSSVWDFSSLSFSTIISPSFGIQVSWICFFFWKYKSFWCFFEFLAKFGDFFKFYSGSLSLHLPVLFSFINVQSICL